MKCVCGKEIDVMKERCEVCEEERDMKVEKLWIAYREAIDMENENKKWKEFIEFVNK